MTTNAIQDAPNLNHLWSALLVEELFRSGVRCFCISPGARSTPLTMAVAQHPKAESIVHFDERAIAFHALGRARATGDPTVLICTSGSAVANYLPAVVEAEASRIPLILLTADRPPELLQCGANQAMEQPGIFGKFTRGAFNLPCPDPKIPPEMLLTAIDEAVYNSRRSPRGPVHINCSYREPLAPVPADDIPDNYLDSLGQWCKKDTAYTTWHPSRMSPVSQQQMAIIKKVNGVERGLLVVGQLRFSKEADAVMLLAKALNWPVFADITSGLRLGTDDQLYVHHYDQLLLAESWPDQLNPDFVLHLGDAVTSKRLSQYLKKIQVNYMHVAAHSARHDPDHRVRTRHPVDLIEFCTWLAPSVEKKNSLRWGESLVEASQKVNSGINTWLEDHPELSEIAVARTVSKLRPENNMLFLGNSMPVRDMDMYGDAHSASAWVTANRGVSGIDGNIATASGYADALGQPITAILGDLTALHDLNALALLKKSRAPVTLIIVNNDGGGIFSFLPLAKHQKHFESHFTTPHGMNFKDAASMFGLDYACPDSLPDFSGAYTSAIEGNASTIIEVRSQRDKNTAAHESLQSALMKVAREAFQC
jgi:2-succinyl-5-enolpyruvyl-6-hydroxy-3-cyclohexene-1-carboxylate synthase